ncbi:LysR family transcriptional regulator [Corynebacterium striatum]
MDYTRAKYFLALARTGSVTAAAEQLGITQPALSRQLRRFEEELELELFERAAGVLRLNEAGKALIPVCQQLVADNNELRRRFQRCNAARCAPCRWPQRRQLSRRFWRLSSLMRAGQFRF